MKILELFILLLCINAAFLFPGCEKESIDTMDGEEESKKTRQPDTDILLSRIYTGNNLFQEFIYGNNKKLIKVNYYYADTVSSYETFEYNDEARVIRKVYSYGSYETYEYNESGRFIKLSEYYEENILYKTTEYEYNAEGLIEKGIVSYGNVDKRHIYYTYDSVGNVLTRTEGPDNDPSFYMSYSEYEYDDKNNPRYNWGLPTDIVQYNNPVRFYNENFLSCMMPPNYEYNYEYNQDGYPVTEIRKMVNTEYIDTLYYEYLK